MATVACPECGLPRSESELGTTPCPVCAANPAAPRTPSNRSRAEPDPTDGLPADASELDAPAPRDAPKSRESDSRVLLLGAVFFFGALIGIGGILGFQALDGVKSKQDDTVAAKPDNPKPPEPRRPAVAPMPRELRAKPADPVPVPEPEPEPEPVQPPPPPGRVTVIELNQPDASYAVPALMRRGEQYVLRGRVKALVINGLDAGTVLDASGLEAATITVNGKIDGQSALKLYSPHGTVHISAKVDGKSIVEINAPGGAVKFTQPTLGTSEGSKIGGGSTVAITGRTVELRGDITGTGTKVSLVLTRSAVLKVATVSGKARVEYKSQAAQWAPPDVTVGPVAPTATFRKVEQ